VRRRVDAGGRLRRIVAVMNWGIRIAAVVGLAMLGQSAALASMDLMVPAPFDGTGLERGVVLIRCRTEVEHLVRQSRGSVLDLGQPHARRDLLLTAAHGLPDTTEAILRSCWAVGAHGRMYRISGPPDRSRAPGLSGSPIVTGADGRTLVVGIHLGWGLQFFDDGRLHPIGIGRPINAEIAAAIAEAAEKARR
jgi:hypothetical protein